MIRSSSIGSGENRNKPRYHPPDRGHRTFLAIFVVNSDLHHSCGFGPHQRHVLSVLLPHRADQSWAVIRPPQFTSWWEKHRGVETTWVTNLQKHLQLNIPNNKKWNLSLLFCNITTTQVLSKPAHALKNTPPPYHALRHPETTPISPRTPQKYLKDTVFTPFLRIPPLHWCLKQTHIF